MELRKINNRLFRRIGDAYGQLIDAEHFLGRPSIAEGRLTKPSCNILYTPEGYEIHLALAGFKKEEVVVEIVGDFLQVRAEAERKESILEEEYLHMDFMPDMQERAFPLPPNADLEKIQAQYSNGLLIIRVPQGGQQGKKGKLISVT